MVWSLAASVCMPNYSWAKLNQCLGGVWMYMNVRMLVWLKALRCRKKSPCMNGWMRHIVYGTQVSSYTRIENWEEEIIITGLVIQGLTAKHSWIMYSLQAARICPVCDAKSSLPAEVLFQVFGQLVTSMKHTDLIHGVCFVPFSPPVFCAAFQSSRWRICSLR